jgi:hypothetical protein
MRWLASFLVIACASFWFWRVVSGKQEGEQGRLRSLRFTVGRYTLWLHHWFYSSLVSAACIWIGVRNPYVYGFLAGGIVQGLTYRDFYYVFFRTERYPFRKL